MAALPRQSWATGSLPLFAPNSATGASLLPAGMILAWCSINPPPGWTICDGSPYPTVNYPDLFAVLGYTFGGSGATFNVPDLAGRVIRGADAAMIPYVLGQQGGADSVTLDANQLPAHTHPITDPGHDHSSVVQGTGYAAADGGTGNRADAGVTGTSLTGITATDANVTTGLSVPTIDPYTAIYYIIKQSNAHA